MLRLSVLKMLGRLSRMWSQRFGSGRKFAITAWICNAALKRRMRRFLPKPGQRSVIFLHNCYYNYKYLARALRARGWSAVVVSLDAPDSAVSKFFHGEDLNIFHPNSLIFEKNAQLVFETARDKFKMVHFYGMGRMSFFSKFWTAAGNRNAVPEDFLELKRYGVKVGYSHSGCMDMVSQSSFYKWSKGCCDKCIWQSRPDVCSDLGNLAWGKTIAAGCDLISIETEPTLDFKSGAKVFRDPLTFAMDMDFWKPNMKIPSRYNRRGSAGEILIYHGVGNYSTRQNEKRNIKGTPAILTAVENLQKKGIPVRLIFVTDQPSITVRYFQAQADIVVDQLNYGRFGATAREGMALGKPTICNMNLQEPDGGPPSPAILECPLIHADESSIEAVLEDLIRNPEKREAIGRQSRDYIVKWWSAEACAARFEEVYDRLQLGLSPQHYAL